MAHYYEKNIVEIKNEYTDFLVNIMAPLMYEGIKSMYVVAMNYDKTYQKAALDNPGVENPGILKIFQHLLKGIPNLGSSRIDAETTRIRDNSKYADIFESLVKAVIKSNIILLTFNASGKKCKLIHDKIHEKTDIKLFIHKCYIECAKQFYNYPELFWHEYSTLEIKKNQRDIIEIIKKAVVEAIRRSLPMKEIIDEYLRNDYIEEEETEEKKYIKIKNMLDKENINEYDEGGIRNILMSESETSDDLNDLETNMDCLNSLIYDRPGYTESVHPIQPTLDDEKQDAIKTPDVIPTKMMEPVKVATEQPKPTIEQLKSTIELTKHSDKEAIKGNSDDDFMKKIQSGEYINELRDIRNPRNNVKRPTSKIFEKPTNEHKTVDTKPPKNDSDDIDVIKDKITDVTNDKNVFFSTMFNK